MLQSDKIFETKVDDIGGDMIFTPDSKFHWPSIPCGSEVSLPVLQAEFEAYL